MKIDFDQTRHIVEKCWEIACTANLPAVGEMVLGPGAFNQVRMTVFQQLINQLVPNNQFLEGRTDSKVEVANEREAWEGG